MPEPGGLIRFSASSPRTLVGPSAMTPYVVLLCAGAKRLSSVLELGEEMRQGLDLFPAFALAYRLDAKIAEKAIEDGGPFFRQGRTAIVLFLPDDSPVASKAGSFEGRDSVGPKGRRPVNSARASRAERSSISSCLGTAVTR